MARLIWTLAVGFDGLIIDGGPNPGGDVSYGTNEIKGSPGRKNWADRRTNKALTRANKVQSVYSGGIGGAVDLLYQINQVGNKHVANYAETSGLNRLLPKVMGLMPRQYGGVLVGSVFTKSGPAIAFQECYVIGPFQRMRWGVEHHNARLQASGTISSPDAQTRLWWAEIERPKKAPHSGPPVISAWR